MNEQRVLLIGSTRNQYLVRAVAGLKSRGAEVLLIAKDERVKQLANEVACAGYFRGNITWRNLSLLRTIRSLHPDIVAFVVGDQFHHENISRALRFWKRLGLLPGALIYASLSHDPASLEYWGESANARLPAERSSRSERKEESYVERWRRLCLPSLAEDPKLGWKNRRVAITAWVTQPGGRSHLWALNINRSGARSSCARETKNNTDPKIFLFGGDRTFGAGLSDEETFAWQLQQLIPSARISNYGAQGYDLGQIALFLPRLIGQEKPDLAFVELSPEVWGGGDRTTRSLESIIALFSRLGIEMILACFGEPPKEALEVAKKKAIPLIYLPGKCTGYPSHQESIARAMAEEIEKNIGWQSISTNEAELASIKPSTEQSAQAPAPPQSLHPSERFHIINFVWGESFTRLFLDVTLPNHSTKGNLFAFSDQCEAIYKIYTTSRDAEVIRSHPLFRQIQRRMPTEVIALDHLFASGWERLDNSLLLMTEMHRVAVNAAYRDDARLVILPPDQVYSEGALQQVIEHAREGYRVVLCAGTRVVMESFVPAFNERFKRADGASPVPPRELVRLALDHLHPITKSLFHDADHFSTGPANLYHMVGGEGYVMHNLHMHVLMIYPRKPVMLKEGNFDTSWLASACPCFDDYYIVDDSDEITAMEISEEAKSVGMGGDGPIDLVRLGAFYRQNGTPIHWQFLKRPILVHTGDLNEQWRKKAREATAFVHSALPLKERLLRWLHLVAKKFICKF